MTPIVQYKGLGLYYQLDRSDPRLRGLLYYVAALVVNRGWAPHVTVTSVERDHPAESAVWSVHEVRPCRGADVRTNGVLTLDQAEQLQNAVNALFDYSPIPDADQPHRCAWFETQEKALARGRDPKLPPVVPHLHLQVPEWKSTWPCAFAAYAPGAQAVHQARGRAGGAGVPPAREVPAVAAGVTAAAVTHVEVARVQIHDGPLGEVGVQVARWKREHSGRNDSVRLHLSLGDRYLAAYLLPDEARKVIEALNRAVTIAEATATWRRTIAEGGHA